MNCKDILHSYIVIPGCAVPPPQINKEIERSEDDVNCLSECSSLFEQRISR